MMPAKSCLSLSVGSPTAGGVRSSPSSPHAQYLVLCGTSGWHSNCELVFGRVDDCQVLACWGKIGT